MFVLNRPNLEGFSGLSGESGDYVDEYGAELPYDNPNVVTLPVTVIRGNAAPKDDPTVLYIVLALLAFFALKG